METSAGYSGARFPHSQEKSYDFTDCSADILYFFLKDKKEKKNINLFFSFCFAGDCTNINETEKRTLRIRTTICRSHRVLSYVGFEPTNLSVINSGVVTA